MKPSPPASDPAALLAELPFVRNLARRLLANEAAADDLSQEVAALAVERPPSRGALGPWVVGVTRNLARLLRRGERRRIGRERVAAQPEARASAADEAARFQSLQRVVAALERIEAADRALLMHRYHDDWPPRRIAAELRLPVNTVRTRLQRALERLRRAIVNSAASRDGDGDGETRLRALLLPLVRAGSRVALQAKLKLEIAAFLIVVLLVGGGVWKVRAHPLAPASAVNSASVVHAAPDATPRRADATADLTRPTIAPETRPTEPATPHRPGPAAVRVHVEGRLRADASLLARWSTPLVVVPAVEVEEFGQVAAHPAPDRFSVPLAVAADGTFAGEIDVDDALPRVARLLLRGDDPAFAAFERLFALPWQATRAGAPVGWRVDVPVFAAQIVTGTVVDEAGAGRGGVAISAFEWRGGWTVAPGHAATLSGPDASLSVEIAPATSITLVTSDRPWSAEPLGTTRSRCDGSFALRIVRPGAVTVVASDGGVATCAKATVPAGGTADLGELVLRKGLELRGCVDWRGHGVAAGVTIAADRERDGSTGKEPEPIEVGDVTLDPASLAPRRVLTRSDGEGRFGLTGLAPGRWKLRVVDTAEGCVAPEISAMSMVSINLGDLGDLGDAGGARGSAGAGDVRLAFDGAIVEFLVRAHQQPRGDALVLCRTDGGFTRVHRGADYWTKADGRTAIVLPPQSRANWFCDSPGFTQARGEVVAPVGGARALTTIDLEATKGVTSAVVRLRGPLGETVERAGFELRRAKVPGAAARVEREVAATDGVFVLRDLEPGLWRARIRPGGAFHAGDGRYRDLEVDLPVDARAEDCEPSGSEACPVREFAIEPAGRLHLSARDGLGAFLPARISIEREVDAGFEPVAVELSHRVEDEMGRLEYVETNGECASADGESCVDPPLVGGRYRVRFELDGYAAATECIAIADGDCSTLEVVMAAR